MDMDTADPDSRQADSFPVKPVDLDKSSSSTPASSGANKKVLRIAWVVIGAGVLVAMSAAITGGLNPHANVLAIRDLAACIMLFGLLLVLGAYRAAWLTKIWEKSLLTSRADPGLPRPRSDLRLPLAAILALLLGAAFFVVAVVALAGGVVSVYALLLLRMMLLAALVSLVVHGTGYLRTFCLGAILPVGLQAVSGIGSAMLFLPPSAWGQMGLRGWEGNLTSLVLVGVLPIVSGVVAVIARFLVESLPGARRDER